MVENVVRYKIYRRIPRTGFTPRWELYEPTRGLVDPGAYHNLSDAEFDMKALWLANPSYGYKIVCVITTTVTLTYYDGAPSNE